jgi:hypothetical protein
MRRRLYLLPGGGLAAWRQSRQKKEINTRQLRTQLTQREPRLEDADFARGIKKTPDN